MGIYRKNAKMQLVLFIAFFILGLNIILEYLLSDNISWYRFVPLALAIIFIGIVIFLYKTEDSKILQIEKKEFQNIRISLYIYFFVYIAHMIMSNMQNIDQFLLNSISSVLLIVISSYGIYVHVKLLRKG